MPRILGVDYDVDYRGRLTTRAGGGPTERIDLSNKQGIVIHYAGGAQNRSISALARWQSYANWHIRPNGFGNGFTGNGIMYHGGVAEDGTTAALYDARVTRWHAGSGHHNRFYVSINVPIGGSQRATHAQLVGLDRLVHAYIRAGVGNDVRTVIGHMEASRSACPGELQAQFVRALRSGTRWAGTSPKPEPKPDPKDDVQIPEADHIVVPVPGIGTFWIIKDMYKRWAMVDEPYFIFGYPIEGMTGEPPIQNFERARMEKQPGSWKERFDIQLGHVGRELAEKRYGSKYTNKEDMFDPEQKSADTSSRRYFDKTEHTIQHGFKSFWEDFGGLEYFGYPISREFDENDKTVQYFERARFEHHKGYDKIYHDVMLGRVNAELLGK